MFWDFRIIKHDTIKPAYFAVHEVYYDDNHQVEAWTEDPIDIVGESKKEILNDIENVFTDIKQPILIESELLRKLQNIKLKSKAGEITNLKSYSDAADFFDDLKKDGLA